MKPFQIISWCVFAIGLIFKLSHYPGTGLLLSLGCLLLLIHGVVYLIKNAKTDLPNSLMHLSFAGWTIYLVFRIQYWSGLGQLFGIQTIFIIPFLLSITWLVLLFKKNEKFRVAQIILIIYFGFSCILSFIQSDRIFYFLNFNTVFNNESRISDYGLWDSYSWFLYIADKPDEALDANKKAQNALEKLTDKRGFYSYDSILIKRHEQQIIDRNWEDNP
jgi:hypothetical protein